MSFDNAIALTGGIASGKSTTAAILSMLGFRIIDADRVAHDILREEATTIAKMFGSEYIDKKGEVDRKKLGGLVFGDDDSRKRLENLLHPRIREEIGRLAEEQERYGKPYFIDIPLFFESGAYPIERSVTVYAPREIQIERLMKRDSLNREDASKRIDLQMDIERKRELSTWTIDNSGDLGHLQQECERVKNEIVNRGSD